uniref:Uncharacterized protein n=1 Tax=Glycine max TaxID=3847 RepID=A0A368UHQ4_SOYBN|eukprot:XP_003534324.2 uncharacterized protein LOC100817102 [Glycine max]
MLTRQHQTTKRHCSPFRDFLKLHTTHCFCFYFPFFLLSFPFLSFLSIFPVPPLKPLPNTLTQTLKRNPRRNGGGGKTPAAPTRARPSQALPLLHRPELLHVPRNAGQQLRPGAAGQGTLTLPARGGCGRGAPADEVAAAGGLQGQRARSGDLRLAPERVAGGGEAPPAPDRRRGRREIARLRGRVAELEDAAARAERDVAERDEMIGFMSRRIEDEGLGGREREREREVYGKKSEEWFQKEEDEMVGSTARSLEEEVEVIYEEQHSQHFGNNNGFDSEFMASASKFWAEKASLWQDVQYESLESMYNTKHFVARRESPWKVDGDSAGVSSKLKLLEQDLLNLEKIGKNHPSKVSSLIKKQAKRYQAISEKIDDLCRRIANEPCEPSLSTEFRTQTQTEFLLEAFRLQQGASETGQKLMALQTEIGKSHYRDELSETTPITRRSLDSIRNNFKEIQRNLEIWLARIIGDLEGILAREGASRVREYYISRYPFVQ